jgi:hypothetical protein
MPRRRGLLRGEGPLRAGRASRVAPGERAGAARAGLRREVAGTMRVVAANRAMAGGARPGRAEVRPRRGQGR